MLGSCRRLPLEEWFETSAPTCSKLRSQHKISDSGRVPRDLDGVLALPAAGTADRIGPPQSGRVSEMRDRSLPLFVDAHTCGDVLDRYMSYPPLLFHSFRWLRPLSLEAAMRVWTPMSVLSMVLVLYVWARWIARQRG